MEVCAGMSDRLPLAETAAYAQRIEALGYDTLNVPETMHDALMVSMLALQATTRLRVRASVILAFVRSPMLVAYTAWDLAAMSGGRFELGLGTQIRQNIEGRFGMPWGDPVGRMREYVESLRAIWHTFMTGEPLRYEGEHYRFTRLQPFFNPGPIEPGPPLLWLGGVNRGIGRLGGAAADGFLTHPTNSNPRYLRELCRPALEEGAGAAGREGLPRLVSGEMWVTGRDAAEVAEGRDRHRGILAFLLSTPAYRRSLELFGWGEVGERLQLMTRTNAWDTLPDIVTDEVLDTLIPSATWADLPSAIDARVGGLIDGLVVPVPADPADDTDFCRVIEAVRRAG